MAASENQLAFVSSENATLGHRNDKKTENRVSERRTMKEPSKIKTGKSLEFSPDDSSQGSHGPKVQSPYQMQNKLIHHVQETY